MSEKQAKKERSIREEMADQVVKITIEYGNGRLSYYADRKLPHAVFKSIFDSCSDAVYKDMLFIEFRKEFGNVLPVGKKLVMNS